ncbi:cyclopropane-fatty-acyl-phospholipid synthase [bacterium (Candidatus Blackallbacteria) CG17_big_fil_post_rev_8_21_14_2_50_48_46]|uniref:Cyclopropane-fatty-acyl-phospholipid synthase n=1 Tax=bacterium (Candidatus Blackallbacteria) CG17_big_fil_post_rev_8_21_14_2_50_48_46 TaxID=2014261 RepID=A0A2M7G145_9BACT|nr:MAG: cyclopropane-fatty-acyl-phospholipid synthase [bacterium (Candidatus Blackallbacteria) CG18_big_fil_WC_8_21_14_2_50_49_26]PIW15366.1 MAG: cyclopropane-fatty-acyl-phospholipid synthase [bacterium (Candidatus Blackallbacteria) CG17_big_fil_post_rev_8_21_14_2_50_48_46]PIW49773.1 MAG: cyclopropane-fatty-acyl-phospholipid synthase [bacterium (Candidatus Blackallbacteria) CG13_big_fil_rev_8_21_14_2_50_49_14]
MKQQVNGATVSEIQAHYDLSNAFYALWLDQHLIYSAALWDASQAEQTLEQAQMAKLDYHLRQLRCEQAEHVLEIGCGWGAGLQAFLRFSQIQSVVGLTLSQAQQTYIEQWALPRASVALISWADYLPAQPLDAILSIGAFEHFARPGLSSAEKQAIYTRFFQTCSDWLKPGGRLALQTIAYGAVEPALQAKISELNQGVFPGSELPVLREVLAAAEPSLELIQLRNDRLDYAKTCQHWRSRLRAAKTRIETEYCPEWYKAYQHYLIGAETGFRLGHLHLYRISFEKPKQKF